MTINLYPPERNEVEFSGRWELMPTNKIPGIHMEIGKVRFTSDKGKESGKTWGVSLDMFGCLAMFTDLPHPDNPRTHQIWRFNPWNSLNTVAEVLIERYSEEQKP